MNRTILGWVVLASVIAHAQALGGDPERTRLRALGERFVESLRAGQQGQSFARWLEPSTVLRRNNKAR